MGAVLLSIWKQGIVVVGEMTRTRSRKVKGDGQLNRFMHERPRQPPDERQQDTLFVCQQRATGSIGDGGAKQQVMVTEGDRPVSSPGRSGMRRSVPFGDEGKSVSQPASPERQPSARSHTHSDGVVHPADAPLSPRAL